MQYRDHFIADLTENDEGRTATLAGRLSNLRDLGGIMFAHLIDATGEMQVRFDPNEIPELDVLLEDCVSVTGRLLRRPEGKENADVSLSRHEMHVDSVEVLARVVNRDRLPALEGPVSEEHVLRCRHYALRRRELQKAIRTRARIMEAIRHYLSANHFCEVETPILAAPTPEGARDFLVPSRLHAGQAYALPQSPQIYKQLLMVGGFDRYYQVARCFRDEDLRANRQPEFTQLDMEMSYVGEQDVMDLVTGLIKTIIRKVEPFLEAPDATHQFTTMSYEESLRRFGTDSPDLRVPYELRDLSSVFENTGFEVFKQRLEAGGAVLGIPVPSSEALGRNAINRLRKWARDRELPEPAWGDVKNGVFESTIQKHFSDEELGGVASIMPEGGQLFFVAAETVAKAQKIAALLRTELGNRNKHLKKDRYEWVWVTDFPAFELRDHRLSSVHHPFTDFVVDGPLSELESVWLGYKSRAYDIVLNGEELGSGSIRIHQLNKQRRVFQKLGYDSDTAFASFRHLLLGLEAGAPPHGGIAIGVDRLVASLLGCRSIRDAIAFPKDGHGRCLMSQSPKEVSEEQWNQLELARLDDSEAEQVQ